MKFSLFAHVERYDQEKQWEELFEESCKLIELAEEGGFETAWIGEHYGTQYTAAPNPLSTIAYLAQRTRRIRLGAGVLIAPFWHPVKLACEAAAVDIMTGGRLEIGIARGAYQYEFDRLLNGMPAVAGGKHLRELVPAMIKVWQGDHAHDGELWQWPAVASVPRPLQDPHPPVWIAARDISSHEFAIANGCNVMVTPLGKDDAEVSDLMAKFESALASHPGMPRPRFHLLRHTYVVSSEEEVPAAVDAVRRFYAYFEHWIQNDGSAVEGYMEPLDEAQMSTKAIYEPQTVRANQVIGTPAEVIARLRWYEELGVDQYGLWLDNTTSYEEKRRMLQLFIDEVMPAFAS